VISIDEGPYLERMGRFMRDIRESKGITQEQMGEILGISQAAVSKIEAGILQVSIFKIAAYASLIKIKVSDFFKCIEGAEAFEKADRTGGNWDETS
jgi:transcriptional regulator with XRE-family HTH domain